MSQTFRRLLPPLIVSVVGMVIVHFWHLREAEKFKSVRNEGATEIAFLEQGTAGVEKRPTSRLIWNEVDKGTVFYTGDIVRTSDVANGTVKLLESGVLIRLEPESVIVLEKNKDSSTINLLSGSLFVDAKEAKTSKSTPTIKSGNTEIALDKKDTQLNLAKNADDSLNMTVTKGEVNVEVAGKVKKIEEGDSGKVDEKKGFTEDGIIQATAPSPNENINLTKNKGAVTFRWKKMAASTKVAVQIGKSKTSLAAVGGSVGGNVGSRTLKVPEGEFFWRLQATTSQGQSLESFVFKAKGVRFRAPVVTRPANGQQFSLAGSRETMIPISWTQIPEMNTVKVVVSKSANFSNPVKEAKLSQQYDYNAEVTGPGTYHIKVMGYVPGTNVAIVGKKIRVVVKDLITLTPPVLIEPPSRSSISLAAAKKQGVILAWREPNGSDTFDLKVSRQGKKVFEGEISDSSHKLSSLAPGSYSWQVKAKGAGAKDSKWSKRRSFKILQLASIGWLTKANQTIEFHSKPTARLKWRSAKGASRYRFRYNKASSNLADANWNQTSKRSANVLLPDEGSYQFEVEALNKDGSVIGKSKSLGMRFILEPQLPAPRMLNASSSKTEADRKFVLKWKKVKKAIRYKVTATHLESGAALVKSTKRSLYQFNNLLPGVWQMKVLAVSRDKVDGKSGATIKVTVPNRSTIAAPEASLIKVNQ